MSTIVEHQAAVASLLQPVLDALGAEPLELSPAMMAADPAAYRDRVLATTVYAPIDLPPFDNSQMDGYAVRAADVAPASSDSPVSLAVGVTTAAGDPPGTLVAGTAAPIMTGAAVPAGADAIIPIEQSDPPRFLPSVGDTETGEDGTTSGIVRFGAPVAAGTFVRAAGSDIRSGEVLLAGGARLTAAQFGTIAAAGVTSVEVRRRARALVLSTGHELRAAGTPLAPGQIHDANAPALTAALQECGVIVRAALVADRADDLIAELSAAADTTDFVITTGGVSAGAFEVVRDALEERGVAFGSVSMQPGGPQGLGTVSVVATGGGRRELPVIAFPGNPVSTLVSFEMFVRPILVGASGSSGGRVRQWLPLADPVDSPAAKHQVRRGTIDADGRVQLIGGPSSHLLHSYAVSTVLAHISAGVDRLEAGEPVEIWRIDV